MLSEKQNLAVFFKTVRRTAKIKQRNINKFGKCENKLMAVESVLVIENSY